MNGNSKNPDQNPDQNKAPGVLKRPGKPDIAFVSWPSGGRGDGFGLPLVMFMGGFRSDMGGTKALYLEEGCRARGQAYIRFDYTGHGQSGGQFSMLTLRDWLDDARYVLSTTTNEHVLVVGSSMGGWLGLRLAMEHPERVCGFVGIAAAPDFTDDMIGSRLPPKLQEAFARDGQVELPNHYSNDPYIITRGLIESGCDLKILDRVHDLSIPMYLLQGGLDEDVRPDTPEKIRDVFPKSNITIHHIKDGDHRLSRPEDLRLLNQCVTDASNYLRL